MGKEKEEANAAEAKRAQAQECYRRGVQRSLIFTDASTVEEVDGAASALREAMVGNLDQHARKKRWCSRSKMWWNLELHDLRKQLGKAGATEGPVGMSRIQEARREVWRAIRKAKKECWNQFLQTAEGVDVWTATGYTPRIDEAG